MSFEDRFKQMMERQGPEVKSEVKEDEHDRPAGETYTGYYVVVSGNQRFPGGGTVFEVAASNPEDAYRQAFLQSQDMTPEEFEEEYGPDVSASTLTEYQQGVWSKEEIDDSSLLLVATGGRSKYEMIGLADSIWAGDEMEGDEETPSPSRGGGGGGYRGGPR